MSGVAVFILRLITFGIGLFYAVLVLAKILWEVIRKPSSLFNNKTRTKPPSCLNDASLGTHGYIHLEELRLHYVASGQEGKPLMLFLHGFPEFWYSWRFQIREFQKDYRVVAVDMRGYADSDKPDIVSSYAMPKLLKDVEQLIPALGYQKCTLVSHDWGGVIAWLFAARHPELLDRLIVMNAPHPANSRQYLLRHFSQFRKSWYIFFFQVPYLPEIFIRLNDYEFVEEIFKGRFGVHNDSVTKEDLEAYKFALSQKGGLSGPINYYRASLRSSRVTKKDFEPIKVPTLLVWGCQDLALEKGLAEATKTLVKNIEVHYIEEASHWVQMDTPNKVNKIMRDWLTRNE